MKLITTLACGVLLASTLNTALGWGEASQTALVQVTIPPKISIGSLGNTRVALASTGRRTGRVEVGPVAGDGILQAL